MFTRFDDAEEYARLLEDIDMTLTHAEQEKLDTYLLNPSSTVSHHGWYEVNNVSSTL
jgi:hypothetical protein